MKNIFLIIFSIVIFTTDGMGASVYTFEGIITELYFDGAGIMNDEGYNVGDPVNACFCVDFGGSAYYKKNDGSVEIPEDPQMTNNPHWYFQATLLKGTRLPEKNGGFNNDPTDIAEYHIGYDSSSPIGNTGALTGGTGDSYLTVRKEGYTDTRVQNWVIGEKVKSSIVGYGDTNWSIMWAEMNLVRVQAIPLQFSCESFEDGANDRMFTLDDLDEAIITERLRWDANNDNKIGLEEVIKYLKIMSGK